MNELSCDSQTVLRSIHDDRTQELWVFFDFLNLTFPPDVLKQIQNEIFSLFLLLVVKKKTTEFFGRSNRRMMRKKKKKEHERGEYGRRRGELNKEKGLKNLWSSLRFC